MKKIQSLFILVCLLSLTAARDFAAGQEADLEFSLDLSSATKPLPKVFSPGIDLSGRGFNRDNTWPQGLAAKETVEAWEKGMGLSGLGRLQYNLWEISELSAEKGAQEKLRANYEAVIKKVNDAGGVVILNIFGMPRGQGRVLDKRSLPRNPRAFKAMIKELIRDLSCTKKYNIWYEAWNAPDLDTFFLGNQQEYLNLYRLFAESVMELEKEYKINIPLGGPGTSSWFRNFEGNSIVTPERSTIYELIKFCYRYKLPLDFISWHGYSSDPQEELSVTVYNKNVVTLIRDWLSYFGLDRNTPLIIDEWNYDRNANVIEERRGKSYISASYIPARLERMNEAGLDYQAYFCLEDFQNNKEGVERNLGVFSEGPEAAGSKPRPKATFALFRMLKALGPEIYAQKSADPSIGIIATKAQDSFRVLIYNYIDPADELNYITRHISALKADERKLILGLVKSVRLDKLISGEEDISAMRAPGKVKAFLKEVKARHDAAEKFRNSPRTVKLTAKGLSDTYLYQRYSVDSSCGADCGFLPKEEKEIAAADSWEEKLTLSPYSVNLIVFNKKPKPVPEEKPVQDIKEEPAQVNATAPAQGKDAAQ